MSPTSTCYMCEAPETSREHAPPLCFFPEIKDTVDGVDRRRNLITVPSCDLHNLKKSKDDEYLWFHLLACNDLNETGKHLAKTKVQRSVSHRPAMGIALVSRGTPAAVYDTETQSWQKTVMTTCDGPRFYGALEHVGRALHFHHFKTKWTGAVITVPSFTLFDGDEPVSVQRDWRKILALSEVGVREMPKFGENPDVFFYQVLTAEETPEFFIRATFYGHAAVTLFFR